ncbi:MAG: MazG family protein [Thermomicrobiales bacterium]
MTGDGPLLTIVGLGPGDPDMRTIGVQRAIDAADHIVLRTRIHPGLDDLRDDPRVSDCDDLYECADRFDDLYDDIAQRVVSVAERHRATVYAVPGHPRYGERSVPAVESRAASAGIRIRLLDGVSFVDTAVGAQGLDPLSKGLLVVDAEQLAAVLDSEPFSSGKLGIDPTRPLLVAQVYNADLAAAVKLALDQIYPADHIVSILRWAGIRDNEERADLPLHALDRTNVDHLTSLFVPPLAPLDAARSPDTLTRIVARLRAPGGCPWDRKQTHSTLRNAVLEEAYEVVDAIDADDPAGLTEELGDLLLLVAMHAQLAEEEGTFRLEDVYEGINRKLIRRHPHVFGDVVATNPEAVIATWNGVKAAERAEAGHPPALNSFDRLPRSMPVTRRVAEIVAPKQSLRAAADSAAGQAALSAIGHLVLQGIDPESAIEAAVRHQFSNMDSASPSVSANSQIPGESIP